MTRPEVTKRTSGHRLGRYLLLPLVLAGVLLAAGCDDHDYHHRRGHRRHIRHHRRWCRCDSCTPRYRSRDDWKVTYRRVDRYDRYERPGWSRRRCD